MQTMLSTVEVETKLRGYIGDVVLKGQSAGLSNDTPLFELGILDSFALFGVVSFISEQFQVSLALERLSAEDFESVTRIARLVQSERGGPHAPTH